MTRPAAVPWPVVALPVWLAACAAVHAPPPHTPVHAPPPPRAAAVAPVERERATSYTTVGEILKQPALFKSHHVRVRGKVAASPRAPAAGERAATVFDLADEAGKLIVVATEKREKLKKGQVVTVEGVVGTSASVSSEAAVMIEAARIVAAPGPRKGKRSAPAGPPDPPPRSGEGPGAVKPGQGGRVF